MASIINASSSGSGGIVQTADASGVLQLQANGTVAFTVNSNGSLTASNTGSGMTFASSAGSGIRVYGAAGTNQWDVYGNGANLRFSDNTGGGRIVIDGTASVGTTFGVGGATPAASGSGVTFPATQSASSDANTLDDYEEGTFTATLSTAATNFSSVSYVGQTGYYTKVGRQVSFVIYLQVSAVTKGPASGNPTIAGLPFTNIGSSPTSCAVAYNANGWVTPPSKAYIESGTSFMYLGYSNSTNSVWNFMGVADVSTGANYVMVAGTYFTS